MPLAGRNFVENIIAEERRESPISPWLITIPLVTAAFLFALNETIANVALPYIAGTISISRKSFKICCRFIYGKLYGAKTNAFCFDGTINAMGIY